MKIIQLITLMAIILFNTAITIDAQTTSTVAPTDYLKLPPGEVNEKRKAAITEILKENVEVEDLKINQTGTPKDILVSNDRIEFKIRN